MNKNQKTITALLAVGIVSLILFLIDMVGIIKESNWVAKFDLYWIHHIHTDFTSGKTAFIKFYTHLGSAEFVIVYTVIIALILFAFRKFVTGLWFGGTVLVGAIIVNYLLKHIVSRVRPAQGQWLVQESGFSFPSGHATASAVFFSLAALFLMLVVHKVYQRIVIGVVAFLLILSIMYSRIYLGVHYPTDVLGGLLIGVAASTISVAVYLLVKAPLHQLLRKWRLNDKTNLGN